MVKNERDPMVGAALGALSAAKNKKLLAGIGAAMIAIGIAGMIVVGQGAIDTITTGGFSPGEGSAFQLAQYVFLFTMLAGLVVLVYSLVGYQRDRSKAIQSRSLNQKRDKDAASA
jgi:formate hydrogenlyase subunit 3/multisubunit Na+/H+ antiporter MnhD subunit